MKSRTLVQKSTQNKSQKVTIWQLDLYLSHILLSSHPDKIVTGYMISTIIEIRIKLLNKYLDGNCYVKGLWKSYAKGRGKLILTDESYLGTSVQGEPIKRDFFPSYSELLCLPWNVIDLFRKQSVEKDIFEQHLTHPQLSEVLCISPCVGLQEDVA